jgi:hypothetical protein
VIEHIASFSDRVLAPTLPLLARRVDEFKNLFGDFAPHFAQAAADQLGRVGILWQFDGPLVQLGHQPIKNISGHNAVEVK